MKALPGNIRRMLSFTVSELEEIYPTASGKSKEDPAYKEAAPGSNAAPAER